MKLRLLAIVASTALVPAISLAQTSPSQPPQSTQARPAQPGAQAPAAADFVNRAAISNMFEVQSSQLAQQKSQNDRVRQFAQRMIQEHTAAGDKLKSTAQGVQGVTVPTSLDQPHQQMVQTLQSASGAGFDRNYIQMQVTAHREAVNLFDQYSQNGDNQQLKQFAQQTLPSLREHLQTVEQIQSALPPAQVGAAQPGTAGSTTGANQGGNMSTSTFVTQREPGMYRASELIGTDVRGGNNEDIGEVGDVLIDRNGQVRAVVIDVGGFLGIGETHVAIPMQQVQVRSGQQNANATGSVTGTTRAPTTGTAGTNTAGTSSTMGTAGQNAAQTGATQTGTGATANAPEPDAIIVMMTREQLQNAPRFQDNNRNAGAGGATGTAPRQ